MVSSDDLETKEYFTFSTPVCWQYVGMFQLILLFS